MLIQEQLAPISIIAGTVEFWLSFMVSEIISIGFLFSIMLTVYFSKPDSSSHSSLSELLLKSYSLEPADSRAKYFSLDESSELTDVSFGKVVSDSSFSLSP